MNNNQNRHAHFQAKPTQTKSRPTSVQATIPIGQRIPLTIKRLGINGEGIGYFKHTICFVKGALPNEVVTATVTEIHPRYMIAKLHTIRKKSPDRVTPRDAYADEVGGFELEHLSYAGQLEFKRDVVRQALEKYRPSGYKYYKLLPTIGMENPYEYRNKAQFQVRELDGKVAAGLYKENSHDLVDLPTCSVQHPLTMKVMRRVVALLETYQVPIYNEKQGSGIIKTVVVRVAVATNEVQLVFITNSAKLPHKRELIADLQKEFPEIVSYMQNVNKGKTSLVWGDETTLLAGKSFIQDKLGELTFNLSARAFYQLNPYQTVKLYDEARKALELSANTNLVDAYSGVGTIGLSLANKAKEVRGMDIIPESITDANENAKLNGITNAKYQVGRAEEVLPQWMAEGFRPDALVVDPPRTGLDDVLIQTILTSKPERFVYISCNPSTLARDLTQLTKSYIVDYIQSIDMFPQTARCEAVVKFTRRH
ncbi:23S rRNA (uracil(1939)-C(5))-methyltransferase RlmD [Pediococcus cellicola]|uniref:23S rRNA (Uracil-5-)-methyltransferase n=1 Tax=Pediococcus cellicola TaxID=319652 RepID=A0A0R2IML9_9LACO|nr:23S rRNA (uracil(1939)-C(5))-methyltransferase RlmD [Pediococcus cellicola]KRN66257.1 23S rRNA (uracil-5-)-methyltransferase [Pediococcus cellicola]GEL15174.1 putative RNA methyltransferase [Pediococcus cellicola]